VRIALGTVELSLRQRAAIGFYYGTAIASRDTCRHFIIGNGLGAIDDQMATLDAWEEQYGPWRGDATHPRGGGEQPC
jgi:hypothetical protein